MSVKVVRLDLWIDPCFDQLIGEQPGMELSIMKLSDPPEENWKKLAEADIYHVSAAKDEVPLIYQVTSELLSRFPRLKVVSSTGSGYDTIDVKACSNAAVLVVNQAGGNAVSVAEHAIGLLLSLTHRITESDRVLRNGADVSRESLMGHELSGKVIGLVGIGQIGSRMATLAKAFGMQVLAYDPYVDDVEVMRRGARPASLEAVLCESDVVSLHCPLTPETLSMVGASEFASMKAGAYFVSTARGGVHDEVALYEALRSGHLAGAGLDVWSVEPPPADHPLLSLPNVVATFHTAGVTQEGRTNVARVGALQIIDIAAGSIPLRMINPEVADQALQAFRKITAQ
ncbi:MAG TPA: hydroxyacid dehydrogenase [Burkholderiaceae bacterium]|nr:hydroxyacid dehydrogenase [Burkholderiaceae bacterium]